MITEKKLRSKWSNLKNRTLSTAYKEKHPSYKSVTISEDWLCYDTFKKDYLELLEKYPSDWHLDKDMLYLGNCEYSKDTCTLLPRELNNLLTNIKTTSNRQHVGVSFEKDRGYWTAALARGDGVSHRIPGKFSCWQDAAVAYVREKENFVKTLAAKWRGKIDERVYNNLMEYTVDAYAVIFENKQPPIEPCDNK